MEESLFGFGVPGSFDSGSEQRDEQLEEGSNWNKASENWRKHEHNNI